MEGKGERGSVECVGTPSFFDFSFCDESEKLQNPAIHIIPRKKSQVLEKMSGFFETCSKITQCDISTLPKSVE